MRFRTLDRYILKEMTGPFFAGLVVYSFLFLINLIFQLVSLAIQQGLSPGVTVVLFLLSLPAVLSYTVPIAVLLGTIIAFSRLSSDSEVTAMRAGGIRISELVKAPMMLASAAALLLLSFNLWLIPGARTLSSDIQTHAAEATQLVRLLRPGVFFDRIPGVILYAARADLETDTYRDVFIYQKGRPGEDILTCAAWARVVRSPEKGILQFMAGDGQSLRFDRKDPGRVAVSEFEEQTVTVDLASASQALPSKALSELYPREIFAKLGAEPESEDPAVVRWCLARCRYLKVNHEEVEVLARLEDQPSAGAVPWLLRHYRLAGLCVTRGPEGLSWHDPDGGHLALRVWGEDEGAPPLVDTVGAGDAVTAAIAAGLADGEGPAAFLERGRRWAGLTCAAAGALPPPEGAR